MKTRLLIYSVLFFFYLFGFFVPTSLSRKGKSLQSEAKQSLGSIAKAEEAYLSEHDRFTADFGRLDLDPIKWNTKKYLFEITVSPDGKGYVATARSKPNWSPYVFDKEEIGMDVWEMNQDLTLKNTVNGVEQLSMIIPMDLFVFWGLPLMALLELVYAFVKKRNASL